MYQLVVKLRYIKGNVEGMFEQGLAVEKTCDGQFLLDLQFGYEPILFPVPVKLKVKVVSEMNEC